MKKPEKNTKPQEEVAEGYNYIPSYEVDTMPKPKRDCTITYPKNGEAEELGIEGDIILDIVVLESGKVGTIKIVKGLGHGLDEASIHAMRNCPFMPATKSGNPVQTKLRWTVTCILDS